MAPKTCSWCSDPNTDTERNLCRAHTAERDGLTIAEYDRIDAALAADLA